MFIDTNLTKTFFLYRVYYERDGKLVPKFKNINSNVTIRYNRALKKLNDQFARRLRVASISKRIKLVKINRRHKKKKQAIQQNFEVT